MWYQKIVRDLSNLPDFMDYYDGKIKSHKQCVLIKGNLEANLARLPGETEMIFSELQEIEAILNYLNIQLRKIKQKHYKEYLEGYNRSLTSRDAERYADADEEVIDYEILINDVAFIRNQYLSLMKSLESKGFQMSSISKLRVAGMEDIIL